MDGTNNRNCVITFKVTEQEKKIIEDYARNKHLSISEYLRQAVFLDSVISVNIEAVKYVASIFWRRFKKFMTTPSMVSFSPTYRYLPLWKSVLADWACFCSFGLWKPK